MNTMGNRLVIIASIFIGLMAMWDSAQADYLIFHKKQCTSDSSCLEPLIVSDPRSTDLYQILLNHTWPTSQGKKSDLSEPEHLQSLLDSNGLSRDYQLIWIPDTLHELHCASLLVQGHAGYELEIDRNYRLNIPEYNRKDFYAQTNEYLKNLIEVNPKASRTDLDHFFDQLNEKGKKYYLFCNFEMGKLLLDRVGGSPEKKDQLKVSQIDEFIRNQKFLQSFRAELARLYNIEVSKFNQHARKPMLELLSSDEDPEQESVLDRSIQLELSHYKKNKGILFRGTNGIETLEGGVAFDSAFSMPPHSRSTRNKSLSYGASLFSGVFRESSRDVDPRGTACPLQFIRSGLIGYVVGIDKDDSQVGQLFELPRLGMIARLFLSGEHFHPRSKVGTKDAQLSDQVSGVFPTGISSVKLLQQLGLIVNPEVASESLGHMIDEYLGENALVLSSRGSPSTQAQVTGFHSTQRDLAQRVYIPHTDFVERVSDFVVRNPSSLSVFSAAVGLLSRIKKTDSSDLEAVVDLLGSKDPNVRLLGVRALEFISPEQSKVRRKIVNRLEDKDEKVVLASIEALKNLAPLDEDTTDAILSSLDNSDLEKYHNAMIEVFVPQFLWSSDRIALDPKIQKSIARRIGTCSNALALKNIESLDPKALKIIVKALGHDLPRVRIAALEILDEQSFTEELFEDVTERLEDKDSSVRARAIVTLDKHHDQLPRMTVVQIAKRMGDQESYVRYHANSLLEHKSVVKSPAVISELIKLFESDDLVVRKFVIKFFKEIDPALSMIPESHRAEVQRYMDQQGVKKIKEVLEKRDFNRLIDELEDLESKMKS